MMCMRIKTRDLILGGVKIPFKMGLRGILMQMF